MEKTKLNNSHLLYAFLLITGLIIFISNLSITKELFASVIPGVMINLSNQNRVAENLPVLKINPKLQFAAQLKADDMASKGYFSHVSPDGTTPWHWLDQSGYQYLAAGENLAVDFRESSDVVDAWMNSLSHRENILNQKYTEIGIAISKGTFNGQSATYVVEYMAKPDQLFVNNQIPTPSNNLL